MAPPHSNSVFMPQDPVYPAPVANWVRRGAFMSLLRSFITRLRSPDQAGSFLVWHTLIQGICLALLIARYPLAAEDVEAPIWACLQTVIYGLVYTALLVAPLALLLCCRRPGPAGWVLQFSAGLAGFIGMATLITDFIVWRTFDHHINAYVVNLVLTPGGLDSMGATTTTWISTSKIAIGIAVAAAAQVKLAGRLAARGPALRATAGRLLVLLTLAFTIALGDSVVAYYARFTARLSFLQTSALLPFRVPLTCKSLLVKCGIHRVNPDVVFNLNRPVICPHTAAATPIKRKLNVIILVAESFRFDLFSPQTTPNLDQFGRTATVYDRHYTGGNRTRMALFAMFYGLPPPLWFPFQTQKIRPLLMQRLDDAGYQFDIRTSQSFTYPELLDTCFYKIAPSCLTELKDKAIPSWRRDEMNTDQMIAFYKNRDKSRPFCQFMFYESTHAPYNFPEDRALRQDYLQDVDFNNLATQISKRDLIYARYVNAAHHIDREVGRLIQCLKAEGLLDDTILIFTGDHGEEFFESGHWGHGHEDVFPSWQVLVPFIVHVPGQKPGRWAGRTSHMQVPATLLASLGSEQDWRQYASAGPLQTTEMPWLIFGNYDRAGVQDETRLVSFPFTGVDYFHYSCYRISDNHRLPRSEQTQAVNDIKPGIEWMKNEVLRFQKNKARSE